MAEPLPTLPDLPEVEDPQFAAKMAIYSAIVSLHVADATRQLAVVQSTASGAFTDPAWSLTIISALMLPGMAQTMGDLAAAIPVTVSTAQRLVDEIAGRIV